MITGSDLTPEQRRKAFRAYRLSAISNGVYCLILLGLAAFELVQGRRSAFVWATVVFGIAMLLVSLLSWSRAKKYR
jgi:hypothetical protein